MSLMKDLAWESIKAALFVFVVLALIVLFFG